MSQERWIVVCNWNQFQHYKDRNPSWIKNYTELLSDPNYLALGSFHRALLHGVWLLYAAARGEVPASPAYIAKRLGFPTEREARERVTRGQPAGDWLVTDGQLTGDSRVTEDEEAGDRPVRDRDLKRLEQAGFITIGARATLAPRANPASPRALARKEKKEINKGRNETWTERPEKNEEQEEQNLGEEEPLEDRSEEIAELMQGLADGMGDPWKDWK